MKWNNTQDLLFIQSIKDYRKELKRLNDNIIKLNNQLNEKINRKKDV